MLLQIDTLGSQQIEMKDKGKSMMRALYMLWYAKRYVSVQSDIKQ